MAGKLSVTDVAGREVVRQQRPISGPIRVTNLIRTDETGEAPQARVIDEQNA